MNSSLIGPLDNTGRFCRLGDELLRPVSKVIRKVVYNLPLSMCDINPLLITPSLLALPRNAFCSWSTARHSSNALITGCCACVDNQSSAFLPLDTLPVFLDFTGGLGKPNSSKSTRLTSSGDVILNSSSACL